MAQDSATSGRSFFRVQARIGLKMFRIDPERWASESRAILEDRSEPAQPLDVELARWLDRIERKLDRLIAQLGNTGAAANAEADRRDLVLSGGGLRFEDEVSVIEGDSLLLELELPRTPSVRIRCLGTAVRVPASENGRGVAVRFDVIREVDRDRIVEYTLELQRAQLRDRSGSSAA